MFEFTTWQTGTDRVTRIYRNIRAQPNWVTRIAAIAFFLVIVIPLLLLGILALLVGLIVFAVLATANKLWLALAGRPLIRTITPRSDYQPGDEMRKNVHVIGRD